MYNVHLPYGGGFFLTFFPLACMHMKILMSVDSLKAHVTKRQNVITLKEVTSVSATQDMREMDTTAQVRRMYVRLSLEVHTLNYVCSSAYCEETSIICRCMRGINIRGLTERKTFKHFGEELIIICQQESGLKYWRGSAPSRKILGGLQPPPPPFLRL